MLNFCLTCQLSVHFTTFYPFFMRKQFYLLTILMLCGQWIVAQTATLTGRVTDKSGDLSGASVAVVGSSVGTAADPKGNYRLAVPAGKEITVQFSGVGYKTQRRTLTLSANETRTLNVEMAEDVAFLNEVVVTGLGINTTQRELGTSRSTVGADVIKSIPSPTVENALVGRMPGVEAYSTDGTPGGGFRVRVRGVSSIFGAPDPLVVIDGIIIDNQNRNTTSTGSAGANTGSASFGMQNGNRGLLAVNPEDVESIEILKGAGAAAIYGSRASNGVIVVTTKKGGGGQLKVNYQLDVGTSEAFQTSNVYKKNWNANEINQWRDFQNARTPNPNYTSAELAQWQQNGMTDWTLGGTRSANFVRHSLNASGGTKDLGYYLTLNKQLNDGHATGTNFNTDGLRLSLSSQAIKGLTVRANLDYSRDFRTILPGGAPGFFYPNRWGYESTLMPFMRLQDLRVANRSLGIQSPEAYARIRKELITDRWVMSGAAEYKITGNLSANLTVGRDQSNIVSNTVYPIGIVSIFPRGRLDYDKEQLTATTLTMGLNHAHQFNEKLYLKSAVGYQWDENLREYYYLRYNNRKDAGLSELDTASYANPQFGSLLNLEARVRTQGFFFNETLGFDERLFINLGGRLERSTSFSEKFFFFPRATVSFQALKDVRLRGSWGETGVQPPPFQVQRAFRPDFGGFQGGGPGIVIASPGNANIRPEKQVEIEFGADVSLFNGKVTAELTYYNKEFTDLLLAAPVNPATNGGLTSAIRNVGSMTTNGFEFAINANLIQNEDMTWTLGVNGSTLNNKVTKLNSDNEVIAGGQFSIAQIRVGYPISGLWGGPATSAAAATTRAYVGSSIPTSDLAFNTFFEYKKFSVRALFGGKFGFYRFNGGERDLAEPSRRMHATLWNAPADELTRQFDNLTPWIQDGSFWKLRQLSFAYEVNGKLLDKLGMKRLSLALTGTNLLTITNYKALYDVEAETPGSGTGNNWVRGIDYWDLGVPRAWTFSLNVGF
jgi:TonB-dependent starch-binding outer membrane protein SusC